MMRWRYETWGERRRIDPSMWMFVSQNLNNSMTMCLCSFPAFYSVFVSVSVLLPAGLRIYAVVQKWVFFPTWVTHYSDKREICTEERIFPLPRARCALLCQILRLSGQKCGNIAPKPSKFGIVLTNFLLRGVSFAQFFRNSQRTHLYVEI